ncbi:OmpA family protein [Psychromonas sp.]|uniref:OmpA family protein n=1 Tax=Psychromonas sp. TaxID=1884585 RepID=UPI003569E183
MKKFPALFLVFFVSACSTQVIDMTEQPTLQKYDLSDLESDGVIEARDNCPNTVVGEQINNTGCGVTTTQVLQKELKINFENASSEVAAEFFSEIAILANMMKKYPETQLTIEGHTSKQGSAAYNNRLSLQRAEAVKDILISRFAVDKTRITAIGYGFKHLLAEGDKEEIHARNRRIVALLSSTKIINKGMKWTIYSVDDSAQ